MSILAIFGPTGSGKTDIAVHAARELNTDVINCDPAQCYRGFPILTNQPTRAHDEIAPHRMINVWDLTDTATVARFAQQAHQQIDDLISERGSVVLCGGSGLYLLGALTQLSYGGVPSTEIATAPADEAIRERLHEEYEQLGGEALHTRLATHQPEVAERIHPNDRKRLIRALEAHELQGSVSPSGSAIWDAPHRRPAHLAYLRVDRAAIRNRIDARTRAMFEAGVLEEVAGVVGPHAEHLSDLSVTAQRLHGLSDCAQVLTGAHSRAQAEELMATRTRQYARRQDTWARRWPGLHPTDVDLTSFDAPRIGTLLAHAMQRALAAGQIPVQGQG